MSKYMTIFYNIVRSFSKSTRCLEENKTKFLEIMNNKNPRNLEIMGLAWKRKGWGFQHPSKEYYHKLVFTKTNRHTSAHVEHQSGRIVTSCSTKQLSIANHLYSAVDQSAAYNIGRVLALRCLQIGIHNLSVNEDLQSHKFDLVKKGLTEGGVELFEAEEYDARVKYEPGIDYDDAAQVEELKQRQSKVFSFGQRTTITKWLNKKRGLRHRYRPVRPPRELIPPQAIYLG